MSMNEEGMLLGRKKRLEVVSKGTNLKRLPELSGFVILWCAIGTFLVCHINALGCWQTIICLGNCLLIHLMELYCIPSIKHPHCIDQVKMCNSLALPLQRNHSGETVL